MGTNRIGVGESIDAAEGLGGGANAFAGPGALDSGILGLSRGMTGRVQMSGIDAALAVWENSNVRKVLDDF